MRFLEGVWDIGFPVLMVMFSIFAVVSAVRNRDGFGQTPWWAGILLFLFWLRLAGDSALGENRPSSERHWKGTVAVFVGVALVVHFGKQYRIWRARRRGAGLVPAAPPMPIPDRDDLVAITMPALGTDVREASVLRWLKGAGDRVEVGEPLLAVAIGKVEVEIPADASGVLWRIDVAEGATVPVGTVLALIETRSAHPSATGDLLGG